MFNGGFAGLGQGQREVSRSNTETQVSIPFLQYILAGSICAVLGIADLVYLWLVFMRFGIGFTFGFVAVAIPSVTAVIIYLTRNVRAQWKTRYANPAMIGIAVFSEAAWLFAGYDFVFFNWPLGFELGEFPLMLMLAIGIMIASFHIFAPFILYNFRNDISDKNWPPTRRPIQGEYGPILPGTKFKPIVEQQEVKSTLLREYATEQFITVTTENGRQEHVTLFECASFLRASETGNRGLSRKVAESCGMKKDVHKALVKMLQDRGLATPNSQGVEARLLRHSDLVLMDLGFEIHGTEFDDSSQ